MEVVRGVDEVRAWRSALPSDVRLAFVPTMGFLHEGHLSLLREGRRRVGPDGKLVLSIFVNPTQFAPNEDLDRYPRDEAGDLAKALAEGVDLAFCPLDDSELYPGGRDVMTWVQVEPLQKTLCGRSRPTHFRGVCTVVTKLWNIVRPDVAVFGQKDFQQLAIIKRMHADTFLCGEVVGHEIVREPDGLAMSSRNSNLSPEERQQALAIPTFLAQVRERFAAGERRVEALVAGAAEAVRPGLLDYCELVDAATLQDIKTVERPAVCAIAVHFARARLLDNTLLTP